MTPNPIIILHRFSTQLFAEHSFEGQLGDDDDEENELQQHLQFLQTEEEEAPIVGVPEVCSDPDENIDEANESEHYSFFNSCIYENPDCGYLPFTTMKIPALLDSGSVFNLLRKGVVNEIDAKIDMKEGAYTTGSDSGVTIGTITINVSLASQPLRKIPFTVVNEHPLKEILGYPVLEEKNQLCVAQIPEMKEWTRSGNDLPELHQQALKALEPTIAFTHMKLGEEQKRYFGFPTPLGTFRFSRAPFGFINSPSNQQFVMSNKVDRPFRLAWKNPCWCPEELQSGSSLVPSVITFTMQYAHVNKYRGKLLAIASFNY